MMNEMPPVAQLTQLLFGSMVSTAISVAAKLGLADLLKDGPKRIDELALKTETNADALYRLLRALASVGVFGEDDEHFFHLTPMAELLRKDVEGGLRGWAIYSGADFHQRVWMELEWSVKTGKPAIEKIVGKPAFDWLSENPEKLQIFNNAMTSMSEMASYSVVPAYDFSGISRLCDVGGGHGFLLASILKAYPKMSGVLYDLPPVVEGAPAIAKAQGVQARFSAVGGNFFEWVPKGCDACVMKSILHDWNDEKSLTILRNCYRVMPKGGRLLIVEMVLPEGNDPSPGKFVDLEMLLHLEGRERTEKEYRALLKTAGFQMTNVIPTRSPYSIIESMRE